MSFLSAMYIGSLSGEQVTCIHILMYVNLLTKVGEQIRGVWDMHMGPYRGAHIKM